MFAAELISHVCSSPSAALVCPCFTIDASYVSAHILNLHAVTSRSQVRAQSTVEDLEQHLEANLRQRRVVAAFTQLVPDERVLGPRRLKERISHVGVCQCLADESPSYTTVSPQLSILTMEEREEFARPTFWRDMVVLLPKNHDELAFDVPRAL